MSRGGEEEREREGKRERERERERDREREGERERERGKERKREREREKRTRRERETASSYLARPWLLSFQRGDIFHETLWDKNTSPRGLRAARPPFGNWMRRHSFLIRYKLSFKALPLFTFGKMLFSICSI